MMLLILILSIDIYLNIYIHRFYYNNRDINFEPIKIIIRRILFLYLKNKKKTHTHSKKIRRSYDMI